MRATINYNSLRVCISLDATLDYCFDCYCKNKKEKEKQNKMEDIYSRRIYDGGDICAIQYSKTWRKQMVGFRSTPSLTEAAKVVKLFETQRFAYLAHTHARSLACSHEYLFDTLFLNFSLILPYSCVELY